MIFCWGVAYLFFVLWVMAIVAVLSI